MIYSGKVKEGKLPKSATITGPETVQIDNYDENKGYKIVFAYDQNSMNGIMNNVVQIIEKPKQINSKTFSNKFLMISNLISLNLETGEFGYWKTINKNIDTNIDFKYVSVEEIAE